MSIRFFRTSTEGRFCLDSLISLFLASSRSDLLPTQRDLRNTTRHRNRFVCRNRLEEEFTNVGQRKRSTDEIDPCNQHTVSHSLLLSDVLCSETLRRGSPRSGLPAGSSLTSRLRGALTRRFPLSSVFIIFLYQKKCRFKSFSISNRLREEKVASDPESSGTYRPKRSSPAHQASIGNLAFCLINAERLFRKSSKGECYRWIFLS
jgi:hypothetical protein